MASNIDQTYLFYDTETTGLNCCFDQVVQFAAIRTDLDLNVISHHEIFIRLNPDVIPSPGASITHRIKIAKANTGVSEWEGIRQIHALLNQPGTISVGYNSIGFDDEVLRFSFYRNLLPPYTHQYLNNCGRMDIYPMTLMYHLFKPSVLEWPKINDKISLKLDAINKANELFEGNAHDAMVDVEITLELARRLKKEEGVWQYMTGYFNKQTDIRRLKKLDVAMRYEQHALKEGIIVHGRLGPGMRYLAPVLELGQHKHYKNQTVWLRLDAPELSKVSIDQLKNHKLTFNRKPAEQQILLPSNPRYVRFLSKRRQQQVLTNKLWLLSQQKMFGKLRDYYLNYKYPKIENIDLDAALYELAFPTQQETAAASQFHQSLEKNNEAMLEHFSNDTQKERAVRLLARNHEKLIPDTLTADYRQLLKTIYLDDSKAQKTDYRNQPRLCAAAALADIERVKKEKSLDAEQTELLDELQTYILAQKEKVAHALSQTT